jgi:Ca-activated chloride channel family protein
MNPSQPFDPNRTVLSNNPNLGDPLKTQAMTPGSLDPNKTSAMSPGFDLNKTSAMGTMKALEAHIIPGREVTMANGPAREQYVLELMAGGGMGTFSGVGDRTPMNLCLVIDRSGSMEGPPLDYVKQACCYVVDILGPNDVLSIVTFEEMVDILMPPQRVTNKQPIKDGIMRVMAGNTTNLYDGLSQGLAQVLQVNDPGRATRLVVLSDGDPTVGIKDFPSLVNHAAEIKSRGVTATFLGFGPDYNEELLAGMAKKAGGNYYYIARPELIQEVFRTELEKLMTVVARNLKLEMKLARWVTLRSTHNQTGGEREFEILLTDLERGATIEQVFDFEFGNHPLGHYRVAAGKLMYDDCTTSKTEAIDLDFVMEFSADSARYSVAVNPRVANAAQIAQASRVVEKTIMGLKTQQLSPQAAAAELQKTQMLLVSQGRTAEAQEVTMALRAIQSGDKGQAEKTLIGTMLQLDQGKKKT